MVKTLLDLRKRPGQPVLAEDFNALLDWVQRVEVRGGPGLRVSRTAAGTFITVVPSPLAVGGGVFEVQVTAGPGGGQAVRVGRGLVEGIEPVIDGVPLGADPAPLLELPRPEAAEGYVYLQGELESPGWRLRRVVVAFRTTPPAAEPWRAWKLVAILRRAGQGEGARWEKALQAVHFNMGHYAYGRRPTGRARHLWFAR